jgi:hypothetical protein
MELDGHMSVIIASELCKYLHPLIATGDILEVYVQHWLTFFKIGFYPNIFIKTRGEWETQVVRKSMSVR